MKLLVTKAAVELATAFTSTANNRIWLSTLTGLDGDLEQHNGEKQDDDRGELRLAMMSEMRASASATTLAATNRSRSCNRPTGWPATALARRAAGKRWLSQGAASLEQTKSHSTAVAVSPCTPAMRAACDWPQTPDDVGRGIHG